MGIDKDEIKRRVSIEQVLDFYGSPPNAKGAFRCPFPQNHNHGEQNPSGSIGKSGDRAFCNSQGCLGEKGSDIFALVGLLEGLTSFAYQMARVVELFLPECGNGVSPINQKILRRYQWTDAQGETVWHLRMDPAKPKFVWNHQPDGKGKPCLEPCKPDLFQRDQVIKAQRVIVCAGERDAETLNGWLQELALFPDVVATTPHTGESTVKAESFALLHGKEAVFVMGDNDLTGQSYRQKVGAILEGKVGTLYELICPPAHNDPTEWKEAGAMAQDFEALLDDAHLWQLSPPQNSSEFRFTSMADLLAEPEEETDWLVENLLPVGGLSVIGGKPKAGKSTTVRNLCLSVARGESFLGFSTTQGPVLYCAFEEKRGEVTKHFRQLGALPDDPIHSFVGRAPDEFITKIRPALHEIRPALIILDTLVKVAHVTDMNDYSQVMKAIDPFLHMARESGAHLLLVHHAGKGDRSGGDALLGSTGIFASVDTCLIQKRSDKYRTLESINRYGTDIEETVLEWNEDTRSISLGGTKKETDVVRLKEEIKVFLKGQEALVSRETLEEAVEGKTGNKRQAIKELVESKEIERSGKGKSGDPFMYQLASLNRVMSPEKKSCSLVPSIYGEQENNALKNGETPHEQKAMSCSQANGLFDDSLETREQDILEQEQPKPEVFDLVD